MCHFVEVEVSGLDLEILLFFVPLAEIQCEGSAEDGEVAVESFGGAAEKKWSAR